jgi:CDP-2,3-bis-(O-geranylgeranyl)-sn-glycerol synthase
MTIFFFGPAGIANMFPVFAAKVTWFKKFDYPLDFHKTYRGKRIFGDHKTIRGFLAGFIGALLMLWIQVFWFNSSEWIRNDIAYIDYTTINIWLWAFVFNFGVLGGDAIKSFFKRQLNHPPGSSWFPFDQLDYVIGGTLASLLLIRLDPVDYIILALVWFLLHPMATGVGFLFRLKDSPI